MRVLFITPYPIGKAASQRFRFEQYFSILTDKKIEFDCEPFLSKKAWDILYKNGFFFQKFLSLFNGYRKRYSLLFKLKQYDYVFVHREVVPFGPPILEFLIAKIFQKKIIYDFDDAIWINNSSESNRLFSVFKWYSNVNYLCKIAYKVSCGNEYLCGFARQYNSTVVYNPTTIDTENHHNQQQVHDHPKFAIGWTGSHSTLKYLNEIVPVLKKLEAKFDFDFIVISDEKPAIELKSLRFVKWNKETEIEDLLDFSIGVMPLPNDRWAKGKCGFKALQYMALGIPALVSPIGVNTKIVDDGVNGFICTSAADWENAIEKLIINPALLIEISSRTQQKIEQHYSVKSNQNNFLNLFN